MNDTTQEATFAEEVAAQVNAAEAPSEAVQAHYAETGQVLNEEPKVAKKACEAPVEASSAPVEAV